MNRLLVVLLCLLASSAAAQNPGVTTQGSVTAGHGAVFVNRNLIKDSGGVGPTGFATCSVSIGTSAIAGTATTAVRSDGACALDQTAAFAFTGLGNTAAVSYQLLSTNFITESTTARTLSASDNGKTILCTNGSATTITVPSGLGAGFTVTIIQTGAGQVGFTASSTTINSFAALTHIVGQYAGATLISTATDVFVLTGGLG